MIDPKKLEAYLKQDRQWLRHCRIIHAQFQRSIATPADKPFWDAVLSANGATSLEV